ncbi:MAG: patatin-like phospholipase family protein [Cyclobacteriaceae bacterium]
MNPRLHSILYSFPLQLLFHHLRRNLALVLLWLFFILTITGGVGRLYGIHYLFLDPEYLHEVGFWSFFLVGLAFGNFTMAFHITCYILDSHRFTFVGILERPFAKFSLNNSLLPFIVLVIYLVLIAQFQLNNEFATKLNVLLDMLGILGGITVMLSIFFIYFKFTNKDIFKFLAGSVDKRLRKTRLSRERMMNKLSETKSKKQLVTSYFDLKFRVRKCQGLQNFYDKEAVLKVFDQNHLNSVVVELGMIALILFLGFFMEEEAFQIPAAASSLLLFSFVLMIVGAISFWLRGWGMAFSVLCMILFNIIVKTGVIKSEAQARGLDYQHEKSTYSLAKLKSLNSPSLHTRDSLQMISILNAWKMKQRDSLPKAVFVCVSGGGQRAALWSVNALQNIDKRLNRNVLDQTILITGASGGMIGAAYYRELMLQRKLKRKVPSPQEQLNSIGQDNLNAIIFSMLVNDGFFGVRKYTYQGQKYKKDRGYLFEQSLNANLGYVLEKPLIEYAQPERDADIPMLLMSPVISNDGRKLYISPQPLSFMNFNQANGGNYKIGGVDFNALFEAQGAKDVNFLSALRMSASFPYITPTVSLPSEPSIEIMDAGISDNFGIADATRFLGVFRGWFEQNTDGVVILSIRDTRKLTPIERESNASLLEKFTYPIASVYNNLANIQDFNNDAKIRSIQTIMKVPVEVIEIEYNTYTNIDEAYLVSAKELDRKLMERASLSWHLTSKEKQNIIDNIQMKSNQEALDELVNILN